MRYLRGHGDVDREAWKLVLEGAESHLDDVIDETGEYSPEDWDRVTDRAVELTRELRAEHIGEEDGGTGVGS